MALIKCNECGHEVSDKASVCPNCGCPIEKKLTCEECGNQLSANDTTCPNCGCPVPNKNGGLEKNGLSSPPPSPVNSAMTSSPQIAQKDSSKSSNAIYYIIGIVGDIVLSVIGCALIRFSQYESEFQTFMVESVGCTAAAIIMIFLVTKPVENRLVFSALAGGSYIMLLLLWMFIDQLTGRQYLVGMGIIEYLIHFTLIIIAVNKRK
ncbi:MAG: zinc ribbon domain-containing protein [Bacteroidaceae bacterium]|nr:zinc ribbon domain-containing protein [Bacteroidaceae bacterium]